MGRWNSPFALAAGAIAWAGLVGCAGQTTTVNQCTGENIATDRLFLQQITDSSAIVKWRGAADAICIGEDPTSLTQKLSASEEGSHKVAVLTGLRPDTQYHYSVGAAAQAPVDQRFRTAPVRGQTPEDGNTHIWLLGDSGTQTEQFFGRHTHQGEAELVKQGFLTYNRNQADDEPLDLLLLLGDNAYLEGTDEQWQGAFFDVYPKIVRGVATWPTIGNHEMGAGLLDVCIIRAIPGCDEGPVMMPIGGVSTSSDPDSYDKDGDGPDEGGLPYLDIFSLPSKAEAGGVPSGTEQYYAFDYGNVHVVSLDSQLSNRDVSQREAMRSWLIDDLGQNDLAWTVVIFHHPPYTKGENHDSDIEQNEIDMRQTFAPVFEDYGVDVVYSGHAHNYERSWYLHGHYDLSATFDAKAHTELGADGQPALGQIDPYQQVSPSSQQDDKAVYTVAGSAGKADELHPCKPGQTMICTPEDWLQHPAHRTFDRSVPGAQPNGLALRGSVILDAGKDTLTSRFIDEHGNVLDYFVISR